jgi:hypothetical protein
VHRYDKHFFDHEVVKTGQYRDHQIDDVLDKCFVMFVTRFGRGRPRGFPLDKDIYVCESRYNEEKFSFNKIKTWASCMPDEVREQDYEMDLYDVPRRMKKMPSPIKHLLREDAKSTDALPNPTWGSLNAPPIVGAVHQRPRELNVSKAMPRTLYSVQLAYRAQRWAWQGAVHSPNCFPVNLKLMRLRQPRNHRLPNPRRPFKHPLPSRISQWTSTGDRHCFHRAALSVV